MDRRRFVLTSLACALATGREGASGQQNLKCVCYAVTTIPMSEIKSVEPFRRELIRVLAARGWIEGQNYVLELRSAEGRPERYPEMMRELVDRRCDVIITTGHAMTEEALRATKTIPLVFTYVDPIASQFVTDISRPRRMTGVILPGPEFEGKRLELVTKVLPRARRIAVLHDYWDTVWGEALRQGAASLGLALLYARSRPNEYSEAFGLIGRERPDAVFIGPGGHLSANRRRIIEFAMDKRIPPIGQDGGFVEEGALMSYSSDRTEYWERIGYYIDRLLKGARPEDLPIEVSTKYELALNLKTAKALGLTIPPSLLARADRVIE